MEIGNFTISWRLRQPLQCFKASFPSTVVNRYDTIGFEYASRCSTEKTLQPN